MPRPKPKSRNPKKKSTPPHISRFTIAAEKDDAEFRKEMLREANRATPRTGLGDLKNLDQLQAKAKEKTDNIKKVDLFSKKSLVKPAKAYPERHKWER